jgi:hypothetical protein
MSEKSARLGDVLNWMHAVVPCRPMDDNELMVRVYEQLGKVEDQATVKLIAEALTTLRARNDRLNKIAECWSKCSERVIEASRLLE